MNRKKIQFQLSTTEFIYNGCFAAANAFRAASGLPALDEAAFTVERYSGFHGTVWSSGG